MKGEFLVCITELSTSLYIYEATTGYPARAASKGLAYDKPGIKATMNLPRPAAPISDATGRNQETVSKEADMKSNQFSASMEGLKNAETSSGTRGSDDGKHKALETSSRIGLSR